MKLTHASKLLLLQQELNALAQWIPQFNLIKQLMIMSILQCFFSYTTPILARRASDRAQPLQRARFKDGFKDFCVAFLEHKPAVLLHKSTHCCSPFHQAGESGAGSASCNFVLIRRFLSLRAWSHKDRRRLSIRLSITHSLPRLQYIRLWSSLPQGLM